MMEQLELIAREPEEHLFPHWREVLREWPREVWRWRHYRNTTGWSCACSGYWAAQALFRRGQISRAQLRRLWRFDRRVQRWDGWPE